MMPPLRITFLGLSITSSWGNGHATTYRGLVRELVRRGHDMTFLERDVPWYAGNRDLPAPPYGRTHLYSDLDELRRRYNDAVRDADLVVVGSYVPDGVAVGDWVLRTARNACAFYDIDTPITLQKLRAHDEEYLAARQIPQYQLYLSFTGGPTLDVLEEEFGSPCARALYCSVDPELYMPLAQRTRWDLGYMGTYSDDRQPVLDRLLLEPARAWSAGRFVVAGPQYPGSIAWPPNVARIQHLQPSRHPAFYNAQRFTLNVTRAAMVEAGYAPSVRLFEAAACATPIISDWWNGLDTFFTPGVEILIAESAADVCRILRELPARDAAAIGERARTRVLRDHTAATRAAELERYARQVLTMEPAA